MNPRLLIPLRMNPRYITGVFSAAICLNDHIRAYSFPRLMNTRLFIPLITNPRIFISAANETAIIHSALNESALTHRRVFRGYLPRLNNVPGPRNLLSLLKFFLKNLNALNSKLYFVNPEPLNPVTISNRRPNLS